MAIHLTVEYKRIEAVANLEECWLPCDDPTQRAECRAVQFLSETTAVYHGAGSDSALDGEIRMRSRLERGLRSRALLAL